MSEEESPALGAELGRWKPCPRSSTDQQTGSPAARHGLSSNTHAWQLKRWSGHPLGEVLTASAASGPAGQAAQRKLSAQQLMASIDP